MFKGISNQNIPVLYQISNINEKGKYYFKLDNAYYLLFPYEQEVLLLTDNNSKIHEIS
jgi:hypothetical protein